MTLAFKATRRALAVLWISLFALVCALPLLLAGAAPAHAEPPLTTMSGSIVDNAGVLDSEDRSDIQAALNRLADDTDYQLFVVYVTSFDGMDGHDWAIATAENLHLGAHDLLLAVATQDRLYGLDAAKDSGLSDSVLNSMMNAIVDELRDSDWAEAAIAGANNLRGRLDSGGAGFAVAGVGVAAVAGGAGYLAWRNKRKKSGQTASAQPDELAAMPTAELDSKASSALLEIDDAVKTSEEELGFAQAEFGLEATTDYQNALAGAKTQLQKAFTLRQQLDDAFPETEPQKRAMLSQILQLTGHAADALDAQKESFEKLRSLTDRAGSVLDETEQRANEINARIDVSRQALASLTTTYPAAALASITQNPDQAAGLVAAARDSVAKGRAALAQENRSQAVAFARVAQTSITQAGRLLDAVDSAGQDLPAAAQKLQQGIASISSDLADAQRLAPNDPGVTAAANEARSALTQAQQATSGGDPLAALTRLTAAEVSLDNVLVPARGNEVARQKAAAMAQQLIGQADSAINQASSYVSARRGGVATEARTRLSEATRLVGEARSILATDPIRAQNNAQQAIAYAQQALNLAHNDIDRYNGGGYGGGNNNSGTGQLIAGMVLGGLIDALGDAGRSSGGRSRHSGGGFGGGFGGFGGGGGRSGGFGGSFGGGGGGGGRGGGGGGRF
ncbi:MAG: TPM domain-containing protein [Propionibacteriaceae bacterium]|nr:TPM domain-containing protein [Propionibacteriaceae bacterium]